MKHAASSSEDGAYGRRSAPVSESSQFPETSVEKSRPRAPAEGEKKVPGGKAEDIQGMRGFPSHPFNGRTRAEASPGEGLTAKHSLKKSPD